MIIHKSLANGRWNTFSFIDQMANVGTDFERALDWRKRGDINQSDGAFRRGMELLEFTIQDPKNIKRVKELALIKEVMLDYLYGDNQYGYTDEALHKYFYCFAYASAMARRR